ncbi:SAM-dependent methyltransferase [candidate division KSB3 bacterium]|uniref:SAM-dependent methyltransferase n=1 Tax=candidate division KSB3 bacterium TaxID=2044937 RepID=A0A2G6KJ88_9BACT|nr:MAG: SAM-dependent methyltransferase [candidate division KSB3 bacterium]
MYNPETETLERLNIGNLQCLQPQKGYRFSLDAILLADFLSVKPDERLIDLGTGNGIIPLLVSVLHPVRQIVGLELQGRLQDLAQRNVRMNNLESRIHIRQGDLKEVSQMFHVGEFDVLCSNPPYRKIGSGRINPRSEQAIARHEIACQLEDLLTAAKFLIKPGGRVYLIYLPERLGELVSELRRYRLEPKKIRCVHTALQTPASLVLIESQRDASSGLALLPPLFLYDRDNIYSDEAKQILRETRDNC